MRSAVWGNGVAVAYYKVDNFGDQLTPEILSHFDLRSFHCPSFRFASAVGVGSILHMLPADYRGFILGSGLITDEVRQFPNAHTLLVRGHLTREILGLPESTLVGDPGLIVDTVYSGLDAQEKQWDVGLIAHYNDEGHQWLKGVIDSNEEFKVKIIDVRKSPAEVIGEIVKCKHILSSSLHGLITADSFGIPNVWIKLSEKIIGGDFKFRDYYSCFNLDRSPIVINGNESLGEIVSVSKIVPIEQVDDIKNQIHTAYKEFRDIVLTS